LRRLVIQLKPWSEHTDADPNKVSVCNKVWCVVVTLVSKNQISPDSLPSYIRELAPEPTRGKKK
jgi:hypothetical protein